MRRFALIGCLLLAACGETKTPPKLIHFGAVIDRTGNNSDPSWRDAISLAVDDANAALAQNPRYADTQFRFDFSDSVNEPALAMPRGLALVRKHSAKALIVDSSQVDISLNQTFYDVDPANVLHVPIQCSDCAASWINTPTISFPSNSILESTFRNRMGWNFRAAPSCRSSARVLIRHLLGLGSSGNGDVNFDRRFIVGIYATNEPYGRSCSDEIKAFAEALMRTSPNPVPVFIKLVFHPRDAEPTGYAWRADLVQLTNASPVGIPDALVVASFAQYHAAFVGNYKGSYSIPVFHLASFRIKSVVQALGTLAEGEEGFSPVELAQNASSDRFAREFQARTGVPPWYLDATYYDNAFSLMLAAVTAAAPLSDPAAVTPDMIRDALPRTSVAGGEKVGPGEAGFARAMQLAESGSAYDYEGASGPMDYDAAHNVVDRLAHYRVQNGAFVELERYDCIADPVKCPVVR
jgi:hypothetical protein